MATIASILTVFELVETTSLIFPLRRVEKRGSRTRERVAAPVLYREIVPTYLVPTYILTLPQVGHFSASTPSVRTDRELVVVSVLPDLLVDKAVLAHQPVIDDLLHPELALSKRSSVAASVLVQALSLCARDGLRSEQVAFTHFTLVAETPVKVELMKLTPVMSA